MIQTYYEIREQLKVINKLCLDFNKGHIQKIYSTTRFISISIRFPSKTIILNLGRGKGHEGIWYGTKFPESDLRVQDTFLHYLRKNLISSTLIGIEIDDFDRIIKLNYSTFEGIKSIYLFWNGRFLYFMNLVIKDGEKLYFCSWNGKEISSNFGYDAFDSVGRRQLENRKDPKVREIPQIDDLFNEERANVLTKKINPKLKNLQNKYKKIESEIENLSFWNDVDKLIQSEDFSLDDQGAFSFKGINVKFPKNWSHFKKLDKIYQKKKSIKKAIVIQNERLQKLNEEIELLKDAKFISEFKDNAEIIKPIFKSQKVDENDHKTSDLKKDSEQKNFEVYKGKIQDLEFSFAIGKNAQGNDHIRSSFANKDDIWFHIEGYKSSHAILKIEKNKSLSIELIRIIASALAVYSKLQISEIPVLYTQVKYLKGVKGSPGKVIYKKQKEISVYFQDDWNSFLIS